MINSDDQLLLINQVQWRWTCYLTTGFSSMEVISSLIHPDFIVMGRVGLMRMRIERNALGVISIDFS